jgi:hypothetical protein
MAAIVCRRDAEGGKTSRSRGRSLPASVESREMDLGRDGRKTPGTSLCQVAAFEGFEIVE